MPKSTQSVIARSDNGNIQITFTIPFKAINKSRKRAALELGKDISIPGFRKGKAPFAKILEHVPENTLLEKTLSQILPDLFSDAIKKHKIAPAIYPKFELISAEEGKDWQVRATTCEFPEFELGNYKKAVAGATPSSAKNKKQKAKKPLTRAEKEQKVIETLLDSIKIKVPKKLIEEEVSSRLSQLLQRLEKPGLTLESYLGSIKKTVDELKREYEKQAKETVSLDLILAKIAEKEKIVVEEKHIDEAINASSADQSLAKELDTPEKRRFIQTILKKRFTLNKLVASI